MFDVKGRADCCLVDRLCVVCLLASASICACLLNCVYEGGYSLHVFVFDLFGLLLILV